MVNIRLIYGWYMVNIRLIYGWYMVNIWLIYGWYMIHLSFFNDFQLWRKIARQDSDERCHGKSEKSPSLSGRNCFRPHGNWQIRSGMVVIEWNMNKNSSFNIPQLWNDSSKSTMLPWLLWLRVFLLSVSLLGQWQRTFDKGTDGHVMLQIPCQVLEKLVLPQSCREDNII